MTHPNQSEGRFEILLANKKLIRKATLKLLDSKGEIISQKSVKIKKGLTKLKMNEKNIIPGVYYIKLINKNETIKTLEHIIQYKRPPILEAFNFNGFLINEYLFRKWKIINKHINYINTRIEIIIY